MTTKTERDLLDEAEHLLDLIQRKWKPDPTSVACFDVRLRNGVENWLTDFTMTNGGRVKRS